MKGSETIKETLHKADCVLYPVGDRRDKVVIVLYQAARAVWSIQENGGKSCEKTVFLRSRRMGSTEHTTRIQMGLTVHS